MVINRLLPCIFIVLMVSAPLNANSEQYKCLEPVQIANNSCTITNYISNDQFTNFQLDYDYHREYMKSVIFRNSKLDPLPSKLFDYFTNITKLDLSHCDIQTIPPNTFKSASTLENLILAHNNLTELYNFEFHSATQLIYIDLSCNKIITINGLPFKGLKKILKIDLSNNQISTLPSNIFNTLNVNELNLNFNQIGNSSDINFSNNGSISLNNNKLQSLDIDNNLGSILHADNNELRSDGVTTGNTGNLIELSLRNNSLTDLHFIRKMSNLLYLDLSFNPLHYNKASDSDIFYNLTNLKTLNLKSINSKNFDFTMLNILPDSLQILDISSNNMTSIDFNSFSMTNLYQLNINDNNLGRQTMGELKYLFHNLNKIDISENDWYCEDLKEVLILLKQANIEVVIDKRVRNESNIRGIRCFEDSTQHTRSSQPPEIVVSDDSVNTDLKIQALGKDLKKELHDIKSSIQNITMPTDNDREITNNSASVIDIINLFLLLCFGVILICYFIRKCKLHIKHTGQARVPVEDEAVKLSPTMHAPPQNGI